MQALLAYCEGAGLTSATKLLAEVVAGAGAKPGGPGSAGVPEGAGSLDTPGMHRLARAADVMLGEAAHILSDKGGRPAG
jgi:hypothetical protein